MSTITQTSLISIAILSLAIVWPVSANSKFNLNIFQVMHRVLERYPDLKIAELQLKQSVEQKKQVESQLGWILNSSTGVTHDLTGLGTPSDRLDISGSIARKLESGSSLSLSGSYRYEDSSLTFNPVLPNPAHTTRLDLSYRLPLSQGYGNPQYIENLVSAEEGRKIANANLMLTRITLAERINELFYSTALTDARINTTKKDIQRTKTLQTYILKNISLGLAEKKDQLQINAQLNSKIAELSTLTLQWKQQQHSLNRLMLEVPGSEISPVLIANTDGSLEDTQSLINLTESYHPAIRIAQSNLLIADSKINSTLDNKKDNLDLVMSVGTRTADGDNNTGSVSERDWAGSVILEYKHIFDERGNSSLYKQALYEKDIAAHNITKANDEIRYTVSGLVSEIAAARSSVEAAKNKLDSEGLKLNEAEQRFRRGRADTAQLIQFQNEYSFAQLSFQQQKIDLNRRIIALQIFTGQFWDAIPAITTSKP